MGFNHTKFIKIYRNTNFDMGFQKKTSKGQNSKTIFFGRVSREPPLNNFIFLVFEFFIIIRSVCVKIYIQFTIKNFYFFTNPI